MSRVGIIGAGSWGTALSLVLANNGHSVEIWSIVESEIEMLKEKHEHIDKLPGVKLPDSITFTTDIEETIKNNDILVLAVPSVFTRSTAVKMAPFVKEGQIIVCVAKGIEENTLMTISDVVESEIPCADVAVMCGPVLIAMRFLHGNVTPPNAFSQMEADNELLKKLKDKEKLSILIIGVLCLLFVPVFKTVTHLPPFMGILMGVGILWFYTEMLYARKPIDEDLKLRLSKVVHRIDGATLLFFLGIFLAVDALRCSGVLSDFAFWLDDTVGNVYAVNLIIGALSSIVDNVPLVAGAIGMYPVATDAMVAAATDPAYLANFMQDGVFWQFLAYCAGVGGSMLIIGSAAGVVVMGLERINFIWYLKNISLLALAGYLSGAVVYILQNLIL